VCFVLHCDVIAKVGPGRWGDGGTRRQGKKEMPDDFSFVCIISPIQINFSVYNIPLQNRISKAGKMPTLQELLERSNGSVFAALR